MADNSKKIKDTYDEGMAEVFKIVSSTQSTPAQRSTAKQTAKDLSSMLIAHTLQTVEGRTALLAGLIVELGQVIDAIQQNPPAQSVLNGLTKVLTKAETLFNTEKQNLV